MDRLMYLLSWSLFFNTVCLFSPASTSVSVYVFYLSEVLSQVCSS